MFFRCKTPLLKLAAVSFILLIGSLGSCGREPNAPQRSQRSNQVTILGSELGPEQETIEAILAPFTEETGIEVVYEGSNTLKETLDQRLDAGNAPDLAMFPQPGLMAEFAQAGDLVPLTKFISLAELQQAFDTSWIKLGSIGNVPYGVWYRVSLKSLVWYRPQAFADSRYAIPTTWAEMLVLSDQIVADGKTPWCIGFESGTTTGWVGTDWVEDIMLRTAGSRVYDQWVTHEIPFNDPIVQTALETFGAIARNDDYVYGGSAGILETSVWSSIQGLYQPEPDCYLHRQGNFIENYLPKNIARDADLDVFPLPPINPEHGMPLLVAGDIFAMFNDTPEARELVTYLVSKTPHEQAVGLAGYLSPRKGINRDLYVSEVSRKQAEILNAADSIRFDASDMMPSIVGTGTFWAGMVDYVSDKDAMQTLDEIEASWPKE